MLGFALGCAVVAWLWWLRCCCSRGGDRTKLLEGTTSSSTAQPKEQWQGSVEL